MRYLGIDWGAKRIGIALSDEAHTMAFPHRVIQFRDFESFLTELSDIIRKEEVATLIIGLPLGMNQQETEQTRIVREAAKRISGALGIPVVFENELFTSKLAAREQGKGQKHDASSAALILQSFLDRRESMK